MLLLKVVMAMVRLSWKSTRLAYINQCLPITPKKDHSHVILCSPQTYILWLTTIFARSEAPPVAILCCHRLSGPKLHTLISLRRLHAVFCPLQQKCHRVCVVWLCQSAWERHDMHISLVRMKLEMRSCKLPSATQRFVCIMSSELQHWNESRTHQGILNGSEMST